jgi:hypothetical protein
MIDEYMYLCYYVYIDSKQPHGAANMNAANENVTVKMYREETKCQCCGRYIRNVVEIDGVQYGTRCCEAYLPRFATVVKGVVVIDYMGAAIKELGQDRVNRFWAQPISQLNDYLQRAIERKADTVEGIKMLIAAKTAARA